MVAEYNESQALLALQTAMQKYDEYKPEQDETLKIVDRAIETSQVRAEEMLNENKEVQNNALIELLSLDSTANKNHNENKFSEYILKNGIENTVDFIMEQKFFKNNPEARAEIMDKVLEHDIPLNSSTTIEEINSIAKAAEGRVNSGASQAIATNQGLQVEMAK